MPRDLARSIGTVNCVSCPRNSYGTAAAFAWLIRNVAILMKRRIASPPWKNPMMVHSPVGPTWATCAFSGARFKAACVIVESIRECDAHH